MLLAKITKITTTVEESCKMNLSEREDPETRRGPERMCDHPTHKTRRSAPTRREKIVVVIIIFPHSNSLPKKSMSITSWVEAEGAHISDVNREEQRCVYEHFTETFSLLSLPFLLLSFQHRIIETFPFCEVSEKQQKKKQENEIRSSTGVWAGNKIRVKESWNT